MNNQNDQNTSGDNSNEELHNKVVHESSNENGGRNLLGISCFLLGFVMVLSSMGTDDGFLGGFAFLFQGIPGIALIIVGLSVLKSVAADISDKEHSVQNILQDRTESEQQARLVAIHQYETQEQALKDQRNKTSQLYALVILIFSILCGFIAAWLIR